jgi:hypothetical protein
VCCALLLAAGAVDKVVSSASSSTKALPTKSLSTNLKALPTPSVPKPVKKAFTPPATPKKDIGINAGELSFNIGCQVGLDIVFRWKAAVHAGCASQSVPEFTTQICTICKAKPETVAATCS